MLIFNVNNKRRLCLSQSEPDGKVLAVTFDEKNQYDDEETTAIPAGDMVMLINYYRHVKENHIHCDFVNPFGGRPRYSWNLVEECLPEPEENVLICFGDGTIASTCLVDGEWELWADSPDDVIAWMPMPPANSPRWNTSSENTNPNKPGSYIVKMADDFMATMEFDTVTGWALWEEDEKPLAWMFMPLPLVF